MEKQLLRDTDFMSMWYGLEVRVPFLDFDVITTAQKINSSLKFDQEQDKFLLIDSFRDELPREIWDRKKQGFQFPFTAWMQDSLDQFIQTKQAQELRHQFKSGLLSWSRYWAYILSVVFMSS
jgi:asparagine synthase (glutamine-hydrolysing)